ncbi:FliH/SctL family protein [Paradevosia shaoguanensis]|uniref:Flagellar assembly protein FliH/Type III secretion system HrpE domain-containing protein n=1 Tax=Paradevosia shaoguanensis TaxID=1335043 RepID=A0AA41QPY9_9HYPH|nr:FliH/SctL family protein [Paradevosia shaoguanensis]MCF1744382.1 hypothetical protein [Paradevosia shaoguanensis]MCI0128865.1 hypothetical protein [Paradevosia shaoguanensis]QMV00834.1 hypothetical protein GHV40_04715 [Devosia sp. D6-9]CDP53077.1 FlbE protein [Devosia sp. DBB001]
MANPLRRFTFDLDLGRASAEPQPSFSETQLSEATADARQEGYAQGYADGEQSASVLAARALSAAAENIAARGVEMAAAVDDARAETLREAVSLATSIGTKLASTLIARYPLAEIEALIAECLATIDNAPHLVIRCEPGLADAVKEIATARMATSSFAGRLVVMGDPEVAMGDCRIEWVDGGLVRDVSAISAEIDKRVAAYLAARGASRREEN